MTQGYDRYSISELKALCLALRFRPFRDRGQHFLVDPRVVEEVIRAAEVTARDEVIEIGPGFGALTFQLAQQAGKVAAVEIEPRLVRWLREECARRGVKNAEVAEGDVIKFFRSSVLPFFRSIVVSSLPYSITSDFFSLVFNDEVVPKRMVLVVQKEVAERLTAKPPHMSLLSIVAQWHGRVEYIRTVPRSAFWPEPEVEGAMIKFDAQPTRRDSISSGDFFALVRKAFREPRRKIGNTLKGNLPKPLLLKEGTIKCLPLTKGSKRSEKVLSRKRYDALLRAADTGEPICNALGSLGEGEAVSIFDKRPGELSLEDWISLYKVMKKLSN